MIEDGKMEICRSIKGSSACKKVTCGRSKIKIQTNMLLYKDCAITRWGLARFACGTRSNPMTEREFKA